MMNEKKYALQARHVNNGHWIWEMNSAQTAMKLLPTPKGKMFMYRGRVVYTSEEDAAVVKGYAESLDPNWKIRIVENK